MNRRTRLLLIGAVAGSAALGAAGVAVAGGALDDDESDTPIPAAELQRASDAALEHTGGGRVTETEVGDEEGDYEVEVTLDSGDQVDVHLDEQFRVVGDETDDAGEDDD